MEKYGVVTEEIPGSKTASGAVLCPVCGNAVAQTGGILRCRVHGSAPFEREPAHGGVESVGPGDSSEGKK